MDLSKECDHGKQDENRDTVYEKLRLSLRRTKPIYYQLQYISLGSSQEKRRGKNTVQEWKKLEEEYKCLHLFIYVCISFFFYWFSKYYNTSFIAYTFSVAAKRIPGPTPFRNDESSCISISNSLSKFSPMIFLVMKMWTWRKETVKILKNRLQG